ncbi:MAG: XRE family transcriptional regulator [Cyclobacteriaceae bacterium]
MVNLNENMRSLRKRLKLTQDQFAAKLDIKRSLLGAYEEGRAEPKLELLQKIAEVFHVSVDDLIGKDFTVAGSEVGNPPVSFQGKSREMLVVTADLQGRDNIELVPIKAAAGYLNGYADAEYVKELPKFQLPILKQGTYRAFEINGDSMLPLLPGTIVIGEHVEDIKSIKSGKTYVLVSQREGVVYKRVFNYLDESGKLFLVSDNRHYSPYQLDGHEVMEAWAAKAYISVQFPDVESKKDVSVEELAGVVLDLQKEIFELKTKTKSK